MTQKEFCKKYNLSEAQFLGKEKIEGNLDLRSVTTLPENCSLTCGGDLDLSSLKTLPENCSLTCGASLILSSLKTLPENCSLTCGGYLDLSSVTTLPENCSLTCGGYLDLSSLTTLPENCSLTCGGTLDLSSLTTLPEKYEFTVGDKVYLPEGINCNYTKQEGIISFQNGKYIIVDCILTEVVSKRGNVYHVKKIGSDKVTYLVTDGNKFSHGDTLKEAKESLMYKIGNRDKSRYANLKKSSVLSLSEMIECYRIITGACEAGVRNFITSVGKVKSEYKISDIIKITKEQYGNAEFSKFFA